MANADINALVLRQIMTYDPITGIFNRRNNPYMVLGRIATKGYRQISVMGTRYMAHRLAWLYIHGVRLPKENAARVTVWRWQQVKRVLRAGQARGGKTLEVTRAFHIALRTAFRLQEAIAAPDGFDKPRRVVTIPPSKENPLPQVVPITRQGYRLMLTMPGLRVSPNEASVLFSELCAQLLIKGLQFRDSRATALTLMARRMDILTLSKISRHKDIRMLQIYFRESAEDISARL